MFGHNRHNQANATVGDDIVRRDFLYFWHRQPPRWVAARSASGADFERSRFGWAAIYQSDEFATFGIAET